MNDHHNQQPPRLTTLLAVVLLLLAPAWAVLQETEPDVDTVTPSATEQRPPADEAPSATRTQGEPRATAPSDEPFRPSETISEDLSVPFPVDI